MNLKSVIIPNTRFLYQKTSDFFNFWNELLADVDYLVKSSNLLDFGSSSFYFHIASVPGSKDFCKDVWVGREVTGHAVLPKDSYFLDIGKTEAFSSCVKRGDEICGVDQFFEESWCELSLEEKERVTSCRVKISFFKNGNSLEEWESEVQYLLK
ncbi:hypothetical protein OAK75_12085 [Bacteriovoracales bacterium]|nr:hypothetical protein [Bacteriovoracales bacterium]